MASTPNTTSKAVREFFIKNGIPEDNIKAAGMTPTDIKRAATAAFDNTNSNKKKGKGPDSEFVKVQLIITNVGAKENP